MKRLDQWRAKLKVARRELNHKERQMNSAVKSYTRTVNEIKKIEGKIHAVLAKT